MSQFRFPKAYKKENKEYIEESATYHYLKYKWLLDKKKSNDYQDLEKPQFILIDIQRLKGRIVEDDEECDKCGYTSTFNKMVDHEHDCLGIVGKRIKFQKNTYSDRTAICNMCNKVFYHTCKTSYPKVQLKRHQKICEKQRKRGLIKQLKSKLLLTLSMDILEEINDILE
jgi:hypothetical protein